MAIRYFDPTEPTLEQQAANQARFEMYSSSVTPEYAQRVGAMFATNPTLRPGTGLSLARAGVDPEGPIAKSAVVSEAKRRQKSGFGWHSIGDGIGKVVGGASRLGNVAEVPHDAIKGFSRGTWIGLEAIPQTLQGMYRESAKDGLSASDLFLTDNIAAGFQQTTLKAGIDQIADSFQEGRPLQGLNYGSGFFGGNDQQAQLDPQGQPVLDPATGQPSTINVGVRQTQIDRARKAAPLVDNHALSIGRGTAKEFFEPGSKPYGLLSGFIDASVLVLADPSNLLGGGGVSAGAKVTGRLGSKGVRDSLERGRTFAGSQGDVVRETDVPMTPAKRVAKAFGDEEMQAGDFLDSAALFGSDNPLVQSTVKSMDEGLLSREDAIANIERMRPQIKVEAGIVEGMRKTVLSDVASDWLTMNRHGRRAVTYFAKSTSVAEMRRATKGKVDVGTLTKLAAAKDENEVISVIGPLLGTTLRERPNVDKVMAKAADGKDSFRLSAKRAKASSRWLSQMPHQVVDLDDVDDIVENAERLARTVQMPLDQSDEIVNALAATGNRNDRLDVYKKFMGKIQDDVLKDSQLDPQARQAVTRLYGAFDDVNEWRAYAIDELGQPQMVPGAPTLMVDGKPQALASPHLLSEHVGQYMPLPDARALRDATSQVKKTLSKVPGALKGVDATVYLADDLTRIFKAGALFRLAYPIRVIAEEQARMGASGFHSAYVHPLSYLSIVTGRRMADDALEDVFAASDEFGAAMSQGSAGALDGSTKVRVPGKFAVQRGDKNFARALADNLAELNADGVAARVARGGLREGDTTPNPLPGIDGIKDWLFYGAGKGQRQMLATGADSKGAPATRSEVFGRKSNPEAPLQSSDGYVDSMVERLKNVTNNDPRLMAAIADGKIDGVPLMREIAPKRFEPNPQAVKRLQALLDEGAGPMYAKGDRFITPQAGQTATLERTMKAYDKGVETMFEYLMSKNTNALSRSPSFKQAYWKRQIELAPYMAADAQTALRSAAQRTRLPKPMLDELNKATSKRSGELTRAEADKLSKAFGLTTTKKLLYDLHEKNQFFDAMRVVMPFGNAFREVAVTWARIGLKENPMVFRRGQQLVNGLRSADVDGDGEGMIFTNDNGEEVYALPFSGWVNEQFTQLPIPGLGGGQDTGLDMRTLGSVKGLNVFGNSVVPGLGPVVTMPLAKVIPNKPAYADVQKLIFPFGETEYGDGVLGGFAGSLMPTWAKKINTAFNGDENGDDDRVFVNTVAYAQRYLLSTGKYDLDSAESMDRLHTDGVAAARKLTMMRGLAQIWSPSAPSQEYVSLDKDGEAYTQVRLVEEYQKLLNDKENGGYKTATDRFVQRFGMDAILSIVSRTKGGAPPTDATNTFAQENPDTVRTHRDVYGYFLERGGEFNNQAYRDQISTGERETITPKEALEIANQRLGQMVFNQYRAMVGDRPNKEQRAWLSTVRTEIEKEYPGFNPTPASLRDNKIMIGKLVAAADDPVLSQTEAGKGLTLYLEARSMAMAEAKKRGLNSFFNQKKAEDLRVYLRDVAESIKTEHPAFDELFERTFNREMIAPGETEVETP